MIVDDVKRSAIDDAADADDEDEVHDESEDIDEFDAYRFAFVDPVGVYGYDWNDDK